MSTATNPFHWSFYTKDDPELHAVCSTLKADKTLFMSRVLAKAVKEGLRKQYPQHFQDAAPTVTSLKPITKVKKCNS